MTIKERASCVNTLELFRTMIHNVYGLIDIVDNANIDKMIELLKETTDHGNKLKWIPITSNILPKERKVYLVTYRTPTGKLYVRDLECSYSGETPKHIEWSKKITGEVLAWMPLPEPYQKEGKQDE